MNLVRPLSAHCPLVLLLLASAQLMLQAQGQKFEGKEVANIQFDPSRQPLEPEELSEILPLKMHAPLRVADVRASIEQNLTEQRIDQELDRWLADTRTQVAIRFHDEALQ